MNPGQRLRHIRSVRGALGATVTLALALSLIALPSAAVAKGRAHTLYWGAQIGTQITGTQAPYDMRPVTAFERVVGKPLSLIELASPFADCTQSPCVYYEFPAPAMENARRYGAIPVLNWASSSSPARLNDSEFQLSDLISGRLDGYLRAFAVEAKRWGHPYFLRFNWEMNGFWFPWSEGVNGNRKGEFVRAWRHVHDIFAEVGATNATWVWCPNVNIYGELAKLRPLYPGGRYVDWTCLDGFNWGKRRGSPGWLSFSQIYHSTYHQIVKEIAPHKPMMIGEIASSDKGGSKAAWIKNMLHEVRTRYRKVRALVWMDINDRGTHWPIETSSQRAQSAFRRGIGNRAFVPNLFADLAQSPIRPPARP